MTPLQELVLTRLSDLDLSYRAAAERSEGLISHGHINYIALGKAHGPMTRAAVNGLALALDVPKSTVEEAAAASQTAPLTEFKLPKKAAKLTPKQQKAVLAYIDALLDSSK